VALQMSSLIHGGHSILTVSDFHVAFVMIAAMKIPNLPDWVAPGLGILFLLLGFLMMFFLMQQGYNAIRRRKRNS